MYTKCKSKFCIISLYNVGLELKKSLEKCKLLFCLKKNYVNQYLTHGFNSILSIYSIFILLNYKHRFFNAFTWQLFFCMFL